MLPFKMIITYIKGVSEVLKMRNRYTDFLINAPLYTKASIQRESITEFINMVKGKEKVSCFCPKCKCERVFKMDPLVAYSD